MLYCKRCPDTSNHCGLQWARLHAYSQNSRTKTASEGMKHHIPSKLGINTGWEGLTSSMISLKQRRTYIRPSRVLRTVLAILFFTALP